MNTWRLSNPKRPQAQLPAPHDHTATRRTPQPWMFISLPYDTCDNRRPTPHMYLTHSPCTPRPSRHTLPDDPPLLPAAPPATCHRGHHSTDAALRWPPP